MLGMGQSWQHVDGMSTLEVNELWVHEIDLRVAPIVFGHKIAFDSSVLAPPLNSGYSLVHDRLKMSEKAQI